MFVADSDQHMILVLDDHGRELQRFGSRGSGPQSFYYPNGLSASRDGVFYIADTRNTRVVLATAQGATIRSFTSGGDGRFPTYVALTPDGMIGVVNNKLTLQFHGGEVAIFDPEGKPLRKVALPEDADPQGITFDGRSWLVTDMHGWRVLKIARDGTYEGELQSPELAKIFASYDH